MLFVQRYACALLACSLLSACGKQPIVAAPAPQPVVLAEQSIVIPEDWKTYSDEEWEVVFRYPPHWTVNRGYTLDDSHGPLGFTPLTTEGASDAFQVSEWGLPYDPTNPPIEMEEGIIHLNDVNGTRVKYFDKNTGIVTVTRIEWMGKELTFIVPDPRGHWTEDVDVYGVADTVIASMQRMQSHE